MLLSELVETSGKVAATRSRLEKVALLASLLRRLTQGEIEIGVSFLSGELRLGRIGTGPAMLSVALSSNPAAGPALTLADVDTALHKYARMGGAGSMTARGSLLASLFSQATRREQEFLARLLLGELRQGALSGIMTEALAAAAGLPFEEIRQALMVAGDMGKVARAALTEGGPGLAGISLSLFRPLQPMLAQSARDLDEAIARHGTIALEWKFDGARIQVHKGDDEVRVYSRNLKDVTVAVPEIVETVRRLPVREAIMEGEALVLHRNGRPQPFQVTMSRFGRKLDVARMRLELPLTPYFFDLLYLDGQNYLKRPNRERFAALAAILPASMIVPRLVTADRQQATAFLADAVAMGHEGVMAKAPEAVYEAGRRGYSWLKVKVANTLDLVVLAAEWGHGRRSGYLSNLHLGARDAETGKFIMLGKTFKGLTDQLLISQTQRLLELETSRDGWTVYVRPELVVEVAFNELQASPRYPGGLALRFARIKGYRPDKGPDDADTMDTVRELYGRQQGKTEL